MKTVYKQAVLLGVVAFGITSVLFMNSEKKTEASSEEVIVKKVDVLPSPSVKDQLTTNTAIQVKELGTTNSSVIQLNTEFTAKSVDNVIDQIREANFNHKHKIYLLLDSPGGSVFDGSRLIAAIGNSKAPVYTVVTGLCASMCAMTLEYGKERYMMDRTTLMFHPASMGGIFEGEVDKIASRISYYKREIDKMDTHTALRSGWTYDAFKLKTQQEFWMDSDDALSNHLIDAVVNIEFVKQVISEEPSAGNSYKKQFDSLRLE